MYDDIEKFIAHLEIYGLCNELVVNDMFKLSKLKNILFEYSQILPNILNSTQIEQYSELLKILDSKILQYYRDFILAFAGEDINEQQLNYPNNHKYCYSTLDKTKSDEYIVLCGYFIYGITQF